MKKQDTLSINAFDNFEEIIFNHQHQPHVKPQKMKSSSQKNIFQIPCKSDMKKVNIKFENNSRSSSQMIRCQPNKKSADSEAYDPNIGRSTFSLWKIYQSPAKMMSEPQSNLLLPEDLNIKENTDYSIENKRDFPKIKSASNMKAHDIKNNHRLDKKERYTCIFPTCSETRKQKDMLTKLYREGLPGNIDSENNRKTKSYPIFNSKRYIKNFIKKDFRQAPERYLQKEYEPVHLLQKNLMNKHTQFFEKEIQIKSSKDITLADKNNFDEQFQLYHNRPELDNDYRRAELLNLFISKHFMLRKEVDTVVDCIKEEEEKEKKKEKRERWKRIIIRAAIHFKRLELTLEEFFETKNHGIKPYENTISNELFMSVKNGDNLNIVELLKENKFLVHDYDYVRIIS